MNHKIIFCLCLLLLSKFGNSQSTCSTPQLIANLPYTATGLSTAISGNNIASTPCNSAYISGNDYVFLYHSDHNQDIKIQLQNTSSQLGGVGLIVTDTCPNLPSASCIGFSNANSNPSIASISLISGKNYYITVSTNSVFGLNSSTGFDIAINELFQNDLEVNSLISPKSSCNLQNENIVAQFKNIGASAISGQKIVQCLVDGNLVSSDTINVSISNNATYNHTFANSFNFSTSQTYNIQVNIVSIDDNIQNNTKSFSITNVAAVSNYPYFMDFESSNGNWATGAVSGTSSWVWGTPQKTIINHASSGTKAWVTNASGNFNFGENSQIESPCFDLSSLNHPILQADIWSQLSSSASVDVQYSLDNGLNWTTLGGLNSGTNWYNTPNGWSGNMNNWVTVSNPLNITSNLGSVKFRFRFAGGISTPTEGFAVDNFRIFERPAYDIGILNIVSPNSTCSSGTQAVELTIKNYGDSTVHSFDLSIYRNNLLEISETVNQTIISGDTISIVLNDSIDFTQNGINSIRAICALLADNFNQNDTAIKTVLITPTISSYPYIEDFENQNWWQVGGTSSSWQLGTPQKPLINSAASGIKSWVTNLTGNYNTNENSYVVSPCLDFSSLISPAISLKIAFSTSAAASVVMESSIDDGLTWHIVNTGSLGENWYNNSFQIVGWTGSSTSWKTAWHTLDGLGGKSNVKIRIRLGDSGGFFVGTDEGIAFDDINIFEMPKNDIKLVEIVSPESSCNLTNAEQIQLKVLNQGTETIDTLIFQYTLNQSQSISDTIFSLLNFGDTAVYTLSPTIDLLVPGNYNLTVNAILLGDNNTNNNTISKEILSHPVIGSFPHNETFENNDGYWYPSGINPSWEWGVPSAPIINNSVSGTKCWATNLDGLHNEGESSKLISPCIDLNNADSAYLEFDIWYEITGGNIASGNNAAYMQYSTDGLNWTILGYQGDGVNWYTSATTWEGSSAGWKHAGRSIKELCGFNSGLLRFVLYGAFTGISEGVAIDNITITQYNTSNSINYNEQLSFVVSPNPFANLINLNKWENVKEISIYDVFGNKIKSNSIKLNEYIDLSNLANGVYFIKIESKNKLIFMDKIIKQ